MANGNQQHRVNCEGLNKAFRIGHGVYRAARVRVYEPKPGDPPYRPLRIYTLDPSVSRMDGAVALVKVPYEPLDEACVGNFLAVDNRDAEGRAYRHANLNDPAVLIRNGHDPSPSSPQFHQQMVYAVSSLTYAAFRKALGRHIAWGFGPPKDLPASWDDFIRLKLRPFAMQEPNAYFDKGKGEVCFGYFVVDKEKIVGRNVPGGLVFTSLSHDVIVHEVTHALLDGLRARFDRPSWYDVLAFHEAFADLIAIFQHFSYKDVVSAAIRKSRGRLEDARILADLAQQFGNVYLGKGQLRSALDELKPDEEGREKTPQKLYSEQHCEAHDRGSILVAAVFKTFLTIFKRKTARYLRLATGGTGVLPEGDIPTDLQELLAGEASRLAEQFLSICIRAIDYCPPVDLEFGEYLRAIITADHDLVPDDPWSYREALVDAFRERNIYPPGVRSLTEDALRWDAPFATIPRLAELAFDQLRFDGDPAKPAGVVELEDQACALGNLVTQKDHYEVFGLAAPGWCGDDEIDLPYVESVRTSRRIGPDGQIIFDLIAEVTQRRKVRGRDGLAGFDFFGGATIIIDPQGKVRYVISKSVIDDLRLERQRQFMRATGARFWELDGKKFKPKANLFKLLHA